MSKQTKQKRRGFWASAYAALHRKGVVTTVYLVLRVLVILTLISQFLNGNFENVFFCVLSLVLFVMPTILERQLKIDLPNVLEIVILLFIFSAWILGEVQTYYTIFPYWDTILHTLNGFLCAAIGFSLVDLLNRHERVSLSMSPLFMAIVAFCFSMTVGVLWEFFECAMDQIFQQDMQKDTIVHAISSVMLDPTGSQRAQAIRGITDVIVVAGGEETFQLAWQCARPNAVVTVVALYDRPQTLPLPEMYGKNLTFQTGGVDGCDVPQILSLIAAGELDTTPLITHTYPLRDIMRAYELFEGRKDGVVKVAVDCTPEGAK